MARSEVHQDGAVLQSLQAKAEGKKDRIYFLPDETFEPIFGLFPTEPELVRKKGK